MKNLKHLILAATLISGVANAQEIGKQAPDFTYTILDGGEFTLSEQLGKVIVIFSFGYSCHFCIASAPYVQSGLVEHYAENENAIIIGLDMWDGPPASVTTFKNNTGLTMPLLLKASGFGSTYSTSHDKLFVVDKKGILTYRTSISSGAGGDVDNAVAAADAALAAPVGIKTVDANTFDFASYPNPAQDFANFNFVLPEAGQARIKIISLEGRTLLEQEPENFRQGVNGVSIDISTLKTGIYFSILEYEGAQSTIKLLVN